MAPEKPTAEDVARARKLTGAVDCDCHHRGVGCLHAAAQRLAEQVAEAFAEIRAEEREAAKRG